MEKWYSCYCDLKMLKSGQWKEILNILFTIHDHKLVAEMFLNSIKANEIWKLWNLWRHHHIIREGCGKKLRRFHTSCHVWCLQNEASRKMNHTVEKDPVRFGVKVTVKFEFDIKTFCIGNRQQRLLQVKFWQIFGSVRYNFILLTAIIDF
jgi:hypothetical protein